MDMADGNTAALRQHEAEQDRRQGFQDQADAERKQLVADYIADDEGKNELDLLDSLGDLAGGGSDILHQIQRIKRAEGLRDQIDRDAIIEAALRIAKLFTDTIDHAVGDELVDQRAEQIENDIPCRCLGDCTC